MNGIQLSRYLNIFPYTNESLEAIMKGLDVNEADDIIAICGSGDQAFAMLEKANSVVAVDNDEAQVEYTQERAEALKCGDISKFLNLWKELFGHHLGLGHNYYGEEYPNYIYLAQPERLEKIRAKLDRLEIVYVFDFMDEVKEGKFSKAYLSNIIGYKGFMRAYSKEQAEYLKSLAGMLVEPGIVYISDEEKLDKAEMGRLHILQKDDALSKIAKEKETSCYMRPAVYRRKA